MTNSNTSPNWFSRDVTIVPSLVVGAGGTGVSVIRHLKRRVRLDWSGGVSDDMPELIQFYAVDTVSYSNRPDQEFLKPDEYGFLGDFDPQQVIANNQAVKDWWDAGGSGFSSSMIPPGIIHLGARQIRALGRVALFHAFPEVWDRITFKMDRVITINAGEQANRAGYKVPVEKSARQVFIVSSICGGTGAGCFLDLAARIREREKTQLKIVGILVMPSAFEHTLPSRRQEDRIKANAFASLKELDAFWYNSGKFKVRYPGERNPIDLKHALFDEIYLIGSEGRGKRLSTLEDVTKQIAHFVYLNTMSNLAGPVGERIVNLDRTRQFYSAFAVGALAIPQSKISDSVLADLKSRYLHNLVTDRRHIVNKQALDSEIGNYIVNLNELATNQSADLISIGISQDRYNQRASPLQGQVVRDTITWLIKTILPTYGLGALAHIHGKIEIEFKDAQRDINKRIGLIKNAQQDINRRTSNSQWRAVVGSWLNRKMQTIKQYESVIKENEGELATLRMLVPDSDAPRGGKRLLSFARDTIFAFNHQMKQFMENQALPLIRGLEHEREAARNRPAEQESLRGSGRESLYYDLEIDPSVEGKIHAFSTLLSRLLGDGSLEHAVSADRTLQPGKATSLTSGLVPPDALQLMGFVPIIGSARPTGHINAITDVTELINLDHTIKIEALDRWEIDSMLDELVTSIVDDTLNKHASLISFFNQPESQEPQRKQEMRKPIEAMIDRVMTHVPRPFWGASPYPDEQKLERFMFISMAADPNTIPGIREFFRKYQDSRVHLVRSSDAYRMDALCIEHAAELKHIIEVLQCKAIYDTFQPLDQQGLHIHAEYTKTCPDPTLKP